jgi:hypothetical protein
MSYDLQAAYQLSMMTTNYHPDQAEIAAIIAEGYFIVVSQSPAHCRYTDATLPSPKTHAHRQWDRWIPRFATMAAARTYAEGLTEADEDGAMDGVVYLAYGPDGIDAIPPANWSGTWTDMSSPDEVPF